MILLVSVDNSVVVSGMLKEQNADTKESYDMYIQSGVSIYPKCLEHTYYNLLWRM